MNLSYRMEIIEDPDEGGYVVSFPDLPGCLTCGETISSAITNAKDAKAAWIDAALENGNPILEPNELDKYSGQCQLPRPMADAIEVGACKSSS